MGSVEDRGHDDLNGDENDRRHRPLTGEGTEAESYDKAHADHEFSHSPIFTISLIGGLRVLSTSV